MLIATDRPQAFQAVAYDDQQQDVTSEVTWSWDFDDGSAADTDNPTEHVFETAGDYTVTVTATFSAQQEQQQVGVDAQQPTGAFVLARATANGYVTLQGTEICHTRYLIAFDAVPRNYDGVRFKSKRAWELEFDDGTFVYPSQQIVLDGQQRNEAWVLEWTTSECPGQAVVGEPNGAVDWQIAGKYLEGVPPEDVEVEELIGEPTYTINNTVVSSATGVLLFDPEDEELDSCEISWATTHQNAFSVEFAVPIHIYDLAGNELYTYTKTGVPLGNDSWVWDGTIFEQEPEGPTTASKGVYTYRLGVVADQWGACGGVRCVCTAEPSCARGDWDKSGFLEISEVSHSDFEWIEPPTEAQVTLDYTLNRNAGQCLLTVYNDDLEEVTVVSPAGGVLSAGAGPHSVEVVFEDANGRVGRYRFVISALETNQDGEFNRDREPKPALQKGANYTSPFSANFGMNGEFGDLGNYGQYAQNHVEAARQAQRSRGFGPWEDSEKQVPADAVGINADHVRRAVSEVKVFSFYGHGIVYANDPGNDGNAIVTRQVSWPARDGALATTAAAAEALSDDYVAYGLVDAPGWTASSYSGTRIVCIFACRSYRNANSIAAFLKNTVGVDHAVGFSRTMHSLLGKVYGEEFWTHFQQYQWMAPFPTDQVRECAQDAVVSFWAYVDAHPTEAMQTALLASDGLDSVTSPWFVVADNYYIDQGTMQQWP